MFLHLKTRVCSLLLHSHRWLFGPLTLALINVGLISFFKNLWHYWVLFMNNLIGRRAEGERGIYAVNNWGSGINPGTAASRTIASIYRVSALSLRHMAPLAKHFKELRNEVLEILTLAVFSCDFCNLYNRMTKCRKYLSFGHNLSVLLM